MAKIIHADGTTLPLHAPGNGQGYTLDEVYAAIGGGCDMVQELPVGPGEVLLMDEEAKMRNGQPPRNDEATALAAKMLLPGDHIVGTVLHVATRDGQWVPLTGKDTSE